MRKNDNKTVDKTYINTLGVPHCHIAMGEAERLVATVRVTSETTNSNSLLPKPNTASNYIQQLVNSANSGDVDNDSQSDSL
jgi:hypothetical protein